MRVGIGVTLTWDDERFVIIAADYRHVTLRSLEADFTRMVDAEELVRLTNVTWHTTRVQSATGSAARVLDGLPERERRIVDAWAEQLSAVKEAVDRGEPAKFLFEDVRAAMSKVTPVTSLETVRRKFHRYCAEGVIGLVDARHLNRGKRDVDARIAAALSELGAKGTSRSSGTTSRTLDRLRWMLEEDYGDAIDLPSERTLYRMVAAHPTARRLNGSAKSRQNGCTTPWLHQVAERIVARGKLAVETAFGMRQNAHNNRPANLEKALIASSQRHRSCLLRHLSTVRIQILPYTPGVAVPSSRVLSRRRSGPDLADESAS